MISTSSSSTRRRPISLERLSVAALRYSWKLSIQLELLLAELASGQQVDQSAVEKIRESSMKQAADRRYEFFEVDDLSQW